MRKLYFLTLITVLFAASTFAQNKVTVKWYIECTGGAFIEVYTDTMTEGNVYSVKAKNLGSQYSKVQPLYNALVGSSIGFQDGSLNEDVEVWLTLYNVNCSNGLYSFGSFNAFASIDVSVIGHPNGYNLANNKYFFLKLKKSPEFNTFLQLSGINPANALLYAYQLSNGSFDTTGIRTVITDSTIEAYIPHFSQIVGAEKNNVLSAKDNSVKPENFSLEQNYPNPFNPSTTITYSIPNREFVELKVYNLLGSEIATLFKGNQDAGTHNVTFNADNLNAGVYFYTIRTNSFSQTRKMTILK